MFYKITEYNDDIHFIDSNGNAVALIECNKAYTPDGINVGFVELDSIEDAIKYFNLKPDPSEIIKSLSLR